MTDWEDDIFNDRKLYRHERERQRRKDRSKYKKTDRDKAVKEGLHPNLKLDPDQLVRGRVISIRPQSVLVQTEDDRTYICLLRGLLKKNKTRDKNLVAVGDVVLFEETEEGAGLIAHVEPRKTVLSRADNLSRRKQQIIAANVELVLITVSVMRPQLKPFLMDRYIIAARKGGMQPVIVINKVDYLDEPPKELAADLDYEKAIYEEVLSSYSEPLFPVSVQSGEGILALKEFMRDKVSVFSGQSGVGKSSLINAVAGTNLETGDTVKKTKKGSHTTTTTSLVHLDRGGWCVDTPGIKSFGVWDLRRDELESYFEEISELGKGCKYPNCTHQHEPGCAVLQAVEAETISLLRYESYSRLLESIGEKHLRR